ncbi:MAG: DUF896 domain-containing protein [Lachnospiraceae bacterium]|nr:DUF896 domain-containing protein [Lachnospiraceae bacterium]
MTDEKIQRINELYHKSKQEGLTEAELEEQKALRKEFVEAIRGDLKNSLNNITIVNPDGSTEDLKDRVKKKKK